jgi:hypothetical protein
MTTFYWSLLQRVSSQSQSQSYITTDGQSASLSWNKAPIWGLRPDLYYCQIVTCLFVWGARWREDGSVVYIWCWPRQRSHFRVWVPWDSWPYFTVSDSRFRFPSSPSTRRATVEVFDPASTNSSLFITSREPYRIHRLQYLQCCC